mmetsp:Transcript_6556/g.15853  ORF Transcript_6556/g.15853 Transcript_6556/m.15853 type:complete len:220 (+) Transcript_6556:257-916(+)
MAWTAKPSDTSCRARLSVCTMPVAFIGPFTSYSQQMEGERGGTEGRREGQDKTEREGERDAGGRQINRRKEPEDMGIVSWFGQPMPICFIMSCIPPMFSILPISFMIFIMFCAPPICCSIRGSIICCILANICFGLRCICWLRSFPPLASPSLPILPTSLENRLYSSSSSFTSRIELPDPLATLSIRLSFICLTQSNSSLVMESIMVMNFCIRRTPSFS